MSDNPYRYVGQKVLDGAFVGRSDLLWRVRSSWAGPLLGNLSVQGSHRMGKTSLVARAVELDTGARPELLFISLSVGDYESGADLFRSIVRKTHTQLVAAPVPSVLPYQPVLGQLLSEIGRTADAAELRDGISEYFGHLGKTGVSIVIVLDEFDRASAVFTRLAEFQFLRSLASERQAIGLVTISRKPINVIEIDAVSGSTLDAVMSLRCYVGCFTDGEIDELLGQAVQCGVDLVSHREHIIEFTGGHPYLLSLLCHEIVLRYHQTGEIAVHAAHRTLVDQFETQFRTLSRALKNSSETRAEQLLLKVLAKGGDSIATIDLDLMRRLGLLREDGASVRLFSAEFDRFVRRTMRPSA